MRRALDYDHMPAPGVPLPFLLAAPWFGAAAGLLVAWYGPDVFASRWHPAALAAIHLVTLGMLTMTMAGSLLQMLPAVAGLPLAGSPRAARRGWIPLGAGAALLAAAFLGGSAPLFALAGSLLAGAFVLVLACVLPTLWQRRVRAPAQVGHIVRGMRAACAALVACGAAGLALVAWLADGPAMRVPALVDIHAALGLAGWVVPLVLAVSFQVIPMFQATDPFPARAERLLVPLVLLALAGWGAGRWLDAGSRTFAALAGAAIVTTYAGLAAALLLRRARSRTAAGTPTWLLALAALAGAAWLFAWPGEPSAARTAAIAVCFLPGFALAAVNGMLYRIVPFLVWYHVRARTPADVRVPKIADLIGPARARAQGCWHAAAVLACLGACVWPTLARPAGMLLAVACLHLGGDVLRPVWRYRGALRDRSA